jgi:hypothetical protein
MKDLMVLNRQHEIYVRTLLSNLKTMKSKIETSIQSYGEKLLKLHDIVQYRSAVPSVQIFPKFKELTDDWMKLHDLSFVLSQLSQINNYLQHLSELGRQHQFDEIVHKLLGENQVETDHTRLQKRRTLKLQESTSLAAATNISIVQPPESNSKVNAESLKVIKTVSCGLMAKLEVKPVMERNSPSTKLSLIHPLPDRISRFLHLRAGRQRSFIAQRTGNGNDFVESENLWLSQCRSSRAFHSEAWKVSSHATERDFHHACVRNQCRVQLVNFAL